MELCVRDQVLKSLIRLIDLEMQISGFGALLALRLSLAQKYPDLRTKGFVGIGSPKICFFINGDVNGEFEKAAFIDGLGAVACVYIKNGPKGKMDLDDLAQKYESVIENGFEPLMVSCKLNLVAVIFNHTYIKCQVVGMAGTETWGAIDPLDDIATFCKKHALWMQ